MHACRAIGLVAAIASSGGVVAGLEAFAGHLGRAARGEFGAALMLTVECQTKDGLRTAVLYGEGVGVWNGRTQFSIARDRMQSVLAMLVRARFAAMPERFGGREDPRVPRRKGAAVVTCRMLAKLDDDGTEKEVVQLDAGYQSPTFKRLARDVLQSLERAAASGVAPHSLDDALRMIADGVLSPVTLEVIATHGEDRPAAARSMRWILTVMAGLLETRVQRAQTLSEATRMRADAITLRRLAGVLADNAVATLPVNLVATDYTDLTVRVLGWKRSIVARQFAQARPDAPGGQDQQRLRRIVDELRELQLRTMSTREPPPPPGRRP
jgi:hypothetical protein